VRLSSRGGRLESPRATSVAEPATRHAFPRLFALTCSRTGTTSVRPRSCQGTGTRAPP
jgi:hypothetical protein